MQMSNDPYDLNSAKTIKLYGKRESFDVIIDTSSEKATLFIDQKSMNSCWLPNSMFHENSLKNWSVNKLLNAGFIPNIEECDGMNDDLLEDEYFIFPDIGDK